MARHPHSEPTISSSALARVLIHSEDKAAVDAVDSLASSLQALPPEIATGLVKYFSYVTEQTSKRRLDDQARVPEGVHALPRVRSRFDPAHHIQIGDVHVHPIGEFSLPTGSTEGTIVTNVGPLIFVSPLSSELHHPTEYRWRSNLKEFYKIVRHEKDVRPALARREEDKAVENLDQAIQRMVEKQVRETLAHLLEESGSKAPNPAPGYQGAIDAGAAFRTGEFAAMLSSEEMAKRLSVSRESINQWRKGKRLLGLTNGTRAVRYPAWQLEPAVRDGLAEVLPVLGDQEPWTTYLFLTQHNPLLPANATPLETLRDGGVKHVVLAAQAQASRA
jgi:hypothetical protein